MKRVLLSLVLVAGVLYAAHAVFSAGDVTPSSAAPTPAGTSGGASEAGAQALSAEALTPSPTDSKHAIAVEQAGLPAPSETAPAGSEATSTPFGSVNLSSAPEPPRGFVKVTSPASIREGPTTSAAIVGIAQPGAEAQVVSRASDWVEIIDPGSKKTGWIHESFLAPQDEPASRPVPPEELASLAETENADAADDDQQTALKSKSRKHASRHRHRRHSIVLGPFILRFR